MDREQLKQLMTDMDKGEAPDNSDVDDVFVGRTSPRPGLS